eukprot:6821439-Pyramimonas_sp.AAC.1
MCRGCGDLALIQRPGQNLPNIFHYQQRRGQNQAGSGDEEALGRVPDHLVVAWRMPAERRRRRRKGRRRRRI